MNTVPIEAALDALILAAARGDPMQDVALRLRLEGANHDTISRRAAARLAGCPNSTLRNGERRIVRMDDAILRRRGVGILPDRVRRRLTAGRL